MKSHIIISIDFELRWGMLDILGPDIELYRKNLEGGSEVVPALLNLFSSRGVSATWAVVGALACHSWDEWVARTPPWPSYKNTRLRWNSEYRSRDPEGKFYFAPHLVDLIRSTRGQELGSHTFSHIYMREPGFTREDAILDARAMHGLFQERWGIAPLSFVFPRNQVAFTDVLSEYGFKTWRMNPWSAEQSLWVRALRLSDSFIPMGKKRGCYFVRFSLSEPLWKMHLLRLQAEASRLMPGEALHLWWHPHNLGGDVPRGMRRVEQLIDVLGTVMPKHTSFSSMNHAFIESCAA